MQNKQIQTVEKIKRLITQELLVGDVLLEEGVDRLARYWVDDLAQSQQEAVKVDELLELVRSIQSPKISRRWVIEQLEALKGGQDE